MENFTGPDGRTETVSDYLQALWCEILRVKEVPVDVSFFSLGGDSMLAIRMLVAVTTEVDRELDYDRFFAAPSIATLSRLIVQAERLELPADRTAGSPSSQ